MLTFIFVWVWTKRSWNLSKHFRLTLYSVYCYVPNSYRS